METILNAITQSEIAGGSGSAQRSPDPYAQAALNPQRRDVGRFRETRKMKIARWAFGRLSVFAPGIAARLAYRALATPPTSAERTWQAKLRQEAKVTKLQFGAGHINVYEWGIGPSVLMVHGWGARATHMGKMIAPLVVAGYRVISFDAPAHGDSSGKHTEPVEFAAAVHAVVKQVGHVHVAITHSFGAAGALLAQRDWGDIADNFVLVSPIESCMWFTEMFREYAGVSAAVMARARQIVVDRYNGRFLWERMSVVDLVRSARRPTLLIHDRDDAEIPFAHSTAILEAGNHVERHATSDLGHHRLLGDSRVIARVVKFVKEKPHRYIG
jgi:pimeloyl-ACP methyl ester carboxylesterase